MPFSPVHSARKFSHVFGATAGNSSNTIRPADEPAPPAPPPPPPPPPPRCSCPSEAVAIATSGITSERWPSEHAPISLRSKPPPPIPPGGPTAPPPAGADRRYATMSPPGITEGSSCRRCVPPINASGLVSDAWSPAGPEPLPLLPPDPCRPCASSECVAIDGRCEW
uniref:Uncharacterized protein n=1 Tax=Anopheles merus TaxID=30066 RepID=A0A182VEM0_ANOME